MRVARWGCVLLAAAAVCDGKPRARYDDPPASTQPPDAAGDAGAGGGNVADPETAHRLNEQGEVDGAERKKQHDERRRQAAVDKHLKMIEHEKLNPKSHPLNEVFHADDLTLQLKPLDPHRLNKEEHLDKHHQAVKQMAKRGGLTLEEQENLEESLATLMRDYQVAKAREKTYRNKRPSLPKDRREITEHNLRETARALHHRFYRIKMKVILAAKSDAPFQRLREMMQSDRFSDQDREAFEEEIREHIQMKDDFAAAQKKRNAAFNHPDALKVPEPDRQKRKQSMRKTIVRRQKEFNRMLSDLTSRISTHAEDL